MAESSDARLKAMLDQANKQTNEGDLLRKLRENIDSGAAEEQAKLVARMHMIRYRAYIAAGFTEDQALLLSR